MQLMLGLNATTITNNSNGYDKQDCFATTKLQTLHKMSSNKVAAQPTLEHFLAMICDLKVDPKMRRRLGLRYTNTPG
uniref:Uncharacterized protein n=2 Tax=Loa loa TaxID=7209 RepID=A0A1I7V8R9_LOALO